MKRLRNRIRNLERREITEVMMKRKRYRLKIYQPGALEERDDTERTDAVTVYLPDNGRGDGPSDR